MTYILKIKANTKVNIVGLLERAGVDFLEKVDLGQR